jgi:hypothetical protein
MMTQMFTHRISCFLLAVATVAALQGYSPPAAAWHPMVDPYDDRSPSTVKADTAQCETEAGPADKRPISGIAADAAYKKAYIECMRKFGHHVVN